MLKLFELYKIGINNKIWVRIALVIELFFLLLTNYSQNIQLCLLIIILFLATIITINILYKEKSWETFLISIFPLINIYLNYKILFDMFDTILISFIVIFSAICFYQAYLWFEAVWKKNFLNLRTEWEKLDLKYFQEHQLKSSYVLLYLSSLFHLLLAFVSYTVDGIGLSFIHQLMIFLLSFSLIMYFNRSILKINKQPIPKSKKVILFKKYTSRLIFLTLIIYFVFDTLLEIYRIRDNSFIIKQQNLTMIVFNLVFLYVAFKSGQLFNKSRANKIKKRFDAKK